jgi:histidinol phosphatase-like PHP family hydrolase
MGPSLVSLHNHTPFSDGAYTIDELVEAHLNSRPLQKYELRGIGICDHLFCTPSSREVTTEKEFDRIFGKEARNYIALVRQARQRWAGRVEIYLGAEINWPLNRNLVDYVRPLCEAFDYVCVEYVDWAGLTQLANQARRWPCPVILAHTDVAVTYPNTSPDQVVRTLANARIIYELNIKQMPLENQDYWFNVLPNHRVQVALGTDTHDDLSVIDLLPQLYEFTVRHGLGPKLFVPTIKDAAAQPTPSQPAASAASQPAPPAKAPAPATH